MSGTRRGSCCSRISSRNSDIHGFLAVLAGYNALVYRTWQRRVKGRDWFDFEWYVRCGVPLDWKHLQVRINEFSGEDVSLEDFMKVLRN